MEGINGPACELNTRFIYFYIMDNVLDLNDLVRDDKQVEKHILKVFEDVLKQCHASIKQYNKVRVKTMEFEIPRYVYGKPLYDINVMRNYLIYHLTDNGLKVVPMSKNKLYISWREADLDIDKFVKRKTEAMERKQGRMFGEPADLVASIDTLKFRQERQRQLSLERQERFAKQAGRFGHIDQSPF
jgi:hypothetical protein